MSTEKFIVVARIGVSTRIPILTQGEFGYDADTKVMRIGDDTAIPPMIATSKSTGIIEYLQNFTPKFGNVQLFEGGKVDGVDLSTLNQANGLVIRTGDGAFVNRELTGEEDYIIVTNGDGTTDGPIVIGLSDKVKEIIDGGGSGNIKFTWGPSFPVNDVKPGNIHMLDDDEGIYIRAHQTDGTEFWMDISSAGGNGGGKKVYFRDLPPEGALLGDEWYDTSESRLYVRLIENTNVFWVERGI